MADLEEARQVHQIKPGDRVLLVMRDGYDAEHVQRVAGQLKERFPDVEFTIVAGLDIVGVQSKED